MTRIFIGRMADRCRVYITAEIRSDGELSITGETYKPVGNRDRDCLAGGQIRDDLRDVVTFEQGWSAERRDRLSEIWDRWHLNHTRAGCEHQRERQRAGEKLEAYPPSVQDVCPECGYRYGSAWLLEELPTDVVEFINGLSA